MSDRDRLPPTAPCTEEEGDSLLREIAAAPSVDIPVELATMVLLEPGTVVDGKFRIEERLGAGGMGVVYAAHDLALGREVAIKLMRLERSVGRLGEKLPDVFDREARATARLNHPNIVTLHQFGNWNGILYLVLERLRGETLSAHLERGRVPLLDALEIMEQVANALVHTHAAGVIHRDLKPQNVFLLADGGVKVLDFGVSGLGLVTAPAPAPGPSEPTAPRTTLSHAGTPGYMAPEQWLGEAQDARTDLWAIGVMLYQLVTDTMPFGLIAAPQRVDLAPLAARVPPEASELVALVEKCLTIRRDEREGDAGEVARTLHRVRTRLDPALAPAVQPRSLTSKLARGSFAIAGFIGLAVATAALWPDRQHSACDDTERELDGIWDAKVRGRLGGALAATGRNGPSTWTAVAMTLDRYSREWVAMRSQACRAGSATSPAIDKCLEERRAQLGRFVREHESIDADKAVWTILAGAQSLAPVSDCADPSYLARWTATAASSLRTNTGLVRAALPVNGPGTDVVHSAMAIGDELVVTGVGTAGGTFAGRLFDTHGTFIARIAGDGSLKWIQTSSAAKTIELAQGRGGDILVGGFYAVETTFAGKALPKPAGGDCFVASLDGATGLARWLVRCGATEDAEARTIAADRDGNVYMAGDLNGRATFGGTREIDAAARPTMAPFVASWSPTGELRWVTAGRGTGFARTKGLALDGDTLIFGTRVVGAGWLGDRELRAGGCVVARLERATGAVRWLRELDIMKCELQDVAVQGERVAAAGRYRGRGAWLEELSADDGADRWRARLGTHDQESIISTVYSEAGPLTVTGYFGGAPLVIGSQTLHDSGTADTFIASFDRDGRVLGALAFGGPQTDRPRWIGNGTAGTVLVAARFMSNMLVGSRELRASGGSDGVLLELALPWLMR